MCRSILYLDPLDIKMARLVNKTRRKNSLHNIYVHRRVIFDLTFCLRVGVCVCGYFVSENKKKNKIKN